MTQVITALTFFKESKIYLVECHMNEFVWKHKQGLVIKTKLNFFLYKLQFFVRKDLMRFVAFGYLSNGVDVGFDDIDGSHVISSCFSTLT